MSHNREIIINSTSPPASAGAASTTEIHPEYEVTVKYRPSAGVTPSQIGNEVARIQKRVNQIIEATPD